MFKGKATGSDKRGAASYSKTWNRHKPIMLLTIAGTRIFPPQGQYNDINYTLLGNMKEKVNVI